MSCPILLFLKNANFDGMGVCKMDFFELLYCGAVLGMGCYLGSMGMKATLDLLTAMIEWVNKRVSKTRQRRNKNRRSI